MKWFFIFMFIFSCQKQEVVALATTNTNDASVAKEEDCDEKAKQVQKVEITEETIKLGGQPDAGCTLE